MLVGLTAVIALGFAVGVPLVPHSPVQLVVFDVVLFNAAPLLAAVLCLRAARRVPEERMVWWGAAAALVLNVAGALVYAFRRPNPYPRIFGFHEIFHVLVIGAVAFQYSAVAFYVLPD